MTSPSDLPMETEQRFESYSKAREFARELGKERKRNKIQRDGSGGFLVLFDANISVLVVDGNKAVIEALTDIDYVISQNDCDEFVATIKELLPAVTDATIRAEALRAIRTCELKRASLPIQATIEVEKELKDKEKALQKVAPHCSKCNIPFELKKTKGGSYMWGCRNFSLPPKHKCYKTKRLTDAEWAMLGLPKTDSDC